MKGFILLLLFTFSSVVSATTYYVATNGNDSNNGTSINTPWRTWQKAFTNSTAGDIVYFRGGVYYVTSGVEKNSNGGTQGNPICYFAYPDDWAAGNYPILDGINKTSVSAAISVSGCSYLYFKGLTVRNHEQKKIDDWDASGFLIMGGAGHKFENCVAQNTGFRGFDLNVVTGNVQVINCDSYDNIDHLTRATYPGNHGEGFCVTNSGDCGPLPGVSITFIGCRAWGNADNGFGSNYCDYELYQNCWAWNNGKLKGDGVGFKPGPASNMGPGVLSRKVINCIAAYNRSTGEGPGGGFDENTNDGEYFNYQFDNNFAYQNGVGFQTWSAAAGSGNRIIRNNIAYANTVDYDWSFAKPPTDTYNSWNTPPHVTVSSADFVSLDTAQLRWARKSDGSLPDITFGHLVEGSDLIHAGLNVGLTYDGEGKLWNNPPSLGAFEYSVTNSNPKPVTGITVAGTGGVTNITTNKGILQLIATVFPTDATNKTVTWTITNGTGQATISASGLVTAVANGIVTARATANDGSGVYGILVITISNQGTAVSSISISGAGGAVTITTDGGSLQLSALVLPSNATNKAVTWSITSGTSLASINTTTGLVTAIDNGTVTARATANDGSGVYGSLIITLSNQVTAVTSITLTGAGGATTITTDGGSLQLSASVLPANATNKTVTWSITSGTSLASINSTTGLVTAIDNGTVTVRATAKDGSGIYGSLVIILSNQVTAVTSITITGRGGATTITIDGGSLQLSASVLPANATNKAVTWSITSGTSLASINTTTGLVTAIDNGTVTARATANDGSEIYGTLVITISNQVTAVTSITVTGAGGATTITTDGGSLQLIASVLPSNATNKTVTWSVTNGIEQATISSSGLLTAVANGTVTARATSQ